MKKAHSVVMILMVFIAQKGLANPEVETSGKDVLGSLEVQKGYILPHGVSPLGTSPIKSHGVSPLGTSSPKKTSKDDTSRVKRAVSAFELSDSVKE